MPFPRLSSRRWFWIVIVIFLTWAILSSRFSGGDTAANAELPVGRRIEGHARDVSNALLMLPGRILEKAQAAWAHLFYPSPNAGATSSDYNELLNQNAQLVREISILQAENQRLQDALVLYRGRKEWFPLVAPKDWLTANIVGHSAGVSSESCILDRGSQSGVTEFDPVFLQFALLGQVSQNGPVTCTVRLLTDPSSKVGARILRAVPQGRMVIVEQCMVHGTGKITLTSQTTKVPQVGDTVILNDKDWSLAIQGAIIGQVSAVRNSENPKFYDVNIEPAVSAHTPGQISIILPAKTLPTTGEVPALR